MKWEDFILVIVIVLLVYVVSSMTYRTGYKKGQIDALIGKIKYELIEHNNKTITWEKIKETDNEK